MPLEEMSAHEPAEVRERNEGAGDGSRSKTTEPFAEGDRTTEQPGRLHSLSLSLQFDSAVIPLMRSIPASTLACADAHPTKRPSPSPRPGRRTPVMVWHRFRRSNQPRSCDCGARSPHSPAAGSMDDRASIVALRAGTSRFAADFC